jgi:hypothetical protein
VGLIDAPEIVVGMPAALAPGTRVFELTDAAGARLGRLVETARAHQGGIGVALARAGAWQAAVTREARDVHGWPQLVLTVTPALAGAVLVTLPDRREIGRLALEADTWILVGYDGRRWGQVLASRSVVTWDSRLVATLSDHGMSAAAGWRSTRERLDDPLRMFGLACSIAADWL